MRFRLHALALLLSTSISIGCEPPAPAPAGSSTAAVTAPNGLVFNGTTANGVLVNGVSLNGLGNNGVNLNGVNLNGVNLNGVNLNGVNLNGVNLNGIRLNGVNLNGVNLNGVNLNGVNLNGIRINGIDLNGVNLNGIRLNGVNLNGVNLNGVNLNGPRLNGIELNGVNLNGVELNGVALDGTTAETFKKLLSYMAACALETTQCMSAYDLDGTKLSYCGQDGLDPGWFGDMLSSEAAEQAVAQCVIDRATAAGDVVTHVNVELDTIESFFSYAVACALPAGRCVDITGADGVTTYQACGEVGLDPGWEYGAPDQSVSAEVMQCVTGRATADGVAWSDTLMNFRQVVFYLIECALPQCDAGSTDAECVAAGKAAAITDIDGSALTVRGSLGLAPAWAELPLSDPSIVNGPELVTACLMARTNAQAQHVQISIRGATDPSSVAGSALAVGSSERLDYPAEEAAFWGNLFTDRPRLRTCDGEYSDPQHGRLCAESPEQCGFDRIDNEGSLTSYYSGCKSVCSKLSTQPSPIMQEGSGGRPADDLDFFWHCGDIRCTGDTAETSSCAVAFEQATAITTFLSYADVREGYGREPPGPIEIGLCDVRVAAAGQSFPVLAEISVARDARPLLDGAVHLSFTSDDFELISGDPKITGVTIEPGTSQTFQWEVKARSTSDQTTEFIGVSVVTAKGETTSEVEYVPVRTQAYHWTDTCATCGNGTCDPGTEAWMDENCSNCPEDCGACPEDPAVCGDTECNSTEDCTSCPLDCGACPEVRVCGDGQCDGGEDCSSCPGDCGDCDGTPCSVLKLLAPSVWDVACNHRTMPGYYWKIGPKVKEYGYYGMKRSRVEPYCNANTLGSKAMTAGWWDETTFNGEWFLVNTEWCRSVDTGDNPCPGSEGPTITCNEPHCGAYEVTCAKWPTCGDGICDPLEQCAYCPEDCEPASCDVTDCGTCGSSLQEVTDCSLCGSTTVTDCKLCGRSKGACKTCEVCNTCTAETCNTCAVTDCRLCGDATCDDGNACTHSDSPSGGTCSGIAYSCDDGNACTADSCNGDGTCTFDATAHCSNGVLDCGETEVDCGGADCGACSTGGGGGQCTPCTSDADCGADARCFQVSGESTAYCHLDCAAGCPSGTTCYKVTHGYGNRCLFCP